MYVTRVLYSKICGFSFWYGEGRPRWLGPISYGYPSHLIGELPGDYGFDIASLAKDPVALHKYFKYVIILQRLQIYKYSLYR